ncbi:hypothetical protein ACFP1Z_14700 [Streptomyces gamaensis]|uniref:Secreted protein n=1 Tax=Streptomyces gamaensis TaxID=1763542 RepID=A0ABW0Z2Z2_9ACTN
MNGVRGVVVGLCALALAGSSLVWAPASQAAGHVKCEGPEHTTYTPGLTFTDRPTRIHARSDYTCTLPSGEQVEAAGRTEAGSDGASCLALDAPRGTEYVHWPAVRHGGGHEEEFSEIRYDPGTAVRIAGAHVVVLKGRVVRGRGKGLEASRTVTLLPAELTGCLTPEGAEQAEGDGKLEIGS